jgi:hypothetical protein
MVTTPYLAPEDRSLRSPEALAEAVARLRGATKHTVFQPCDQRYVRSCPDFTVSARMDHINGVWAVCCESSSSSWTSGLHRCLGSLLPNEALDWGEQLWNGQARIQPRADAGAGMV